MTTIKHSPKIHLLGSITRLYGSDLLNDFSCSNFSSSPCLSLFLATFVIVRQRGNVLCRSLWRCREFPCAQVAAALISQSSKQLHDPRRLSLFVFHLISHLDFIPPSVLYCIALAHSRLMAFDVVLMTWTSTLKKTNESGGALPRDERGNSGKFLILVSWFSAEIRWIHNIVQATSLNLVDFFYFIFYFPFHAISPFLIRISLFFISLQDLHPCPMCHQGIPQWVEWTDECHKESLTIWTWTLSHRV